jgi:hypothetical protein
MGEITMDSRNKGDDLSINKVVSKVQLCSFVLPLPPKCFPKTDQYLVVAKMKERLSASKHILKELHMENRLCGIVVRISGYRSRDSGSIPGATRFPNIFQSPHLCIMICKPADSGLSGSLVYRRLWLVDPNQGGTIKSFCVLTRHGTVPNTLARLVNAESFSRLRKQLCDISIRNFTIIEIFQFPYSPSNNGISLLFERTMQK